MPDTTRSEASWYYVEKGQQAGPFTVEQFAGLVQERRITADTLVWHAGLDAWKRYGDLATPEAQAEPSVIPAGPAGDATPFPCSVCGRVFSVGDLLAFENARVCADCKPAFVQRLKENAEVAGAVHYGAAAMRYGGFWWRALAWFIDYWIMAIAQMIVLMPLIILPAMMAGNDASPFLMIGLQLVANLLSLALSAAYEIWMVGRFGATVGKMACSLKVVTAEGGRVSYGRAAGRHFAKYINAFTLGIGYIIAGFDKEKKALHDIICSTRVVKK